MATVTLQQINKNILKLQDEVKQIKERMNDFRDMDLEVRPEYLKKLDKIEKGKFLSRNEFEKEVNN